MQHSSGFLVLCQCVKNKEAKKKRRSEYPESLLVRAVPDDWPMENLSPVLGLSGQGFTLLHTAITFFGQPYAVTSCLMPVPSVMPV